MVPIRASRRTSLSAAAGALIAIKVPKDFGDKKLTWTLTANGKTVAVPFGVTKGYQIEPFLDAAMGNKPPVIKFSENGYRAHRSAAAARAGARNQRRRRRERRDQVLDLATTATRSRRQAVRPRRRHRVARRRGRRAGRG